MSEDLTQEEQKDQAHHQSDCLREEDLIACLQQSIDESDAAIETIVDCFMEIHFATSKLIHSEEMTGEDMKCAEQIWQAIPRIVSALQFQDRLKQRLTHVKLIAGKRNNFNENGSDVKSVQLDNHMDLLSEQVDGVEIVLFSEAA